MEYYIVKKTELINEKISISEIGYVTTQEDANTINEIHKSDYELWREENLSDILSGSLSKVDFLSSNSCYHDCDIITSGLEGRSLNQIINLNTLE